MTKLEMKFLMSAHRKLQEAFEEFKITDISVDEIKIKFDIKGSVAGQAKYENGLFTLRFNPQAIEKYNEEMLNNTLPHEVAHIVCMIKPELGKNHDKGFRRIATILGDVKRGKRTHSYKLEKARSLKQYKYDVNGSIVELSSIRHKRLQSGKCRYQHGKYGNILPSMLIS